MSNTQQTDEERIVERMAFEMRVKLRANRDKDGWSACDTVWLIDRLQEEFTELRDAALCGADDYALWREAADVANFAAMVADVARDFTEVP